ncbi:MAG TPA: hypothetical protein VGD65_22750 [Chryseosolibacter sp.]
MGKDREGKFHPRKGKPSGSLRTDSPGLKPISTGSYEEHLEIADKYTVGEEEPAPNLRVRHRNRNTDKREDRQVDKSDAKNTKAKRDTFDDSEMVIAQAEEISGFLNKETFSALANHQGDTCISIYLQTHRKGSEVNELVDNTVFKNYLQQITAQLKQKKMDELTLEKILAPAYELLRNDTFWRQQSNGLAVFITEGSTQYLKLPFTPKQEELVINTSYYLSPLTAMMTHGDYFYLLMLSKKGAKLYRAGEHGIVELIIDEMPNGVDDVVHFEEKDDQKLFRTGSSGGGGGANFHGVGAGKPDDKENIAMYFDEVDETLWKAVLNKENVPLLLAGVDYLIPIYKSVAKYKPIWDEAITGNQQYTDLASLHEQARKIMQPYFEERHKKALELYGNQSATQLTSTNGEEIIAAAHYKRVWHLFVQEGAHIWGTFDEMNNKVTVHPSQQEGDEDLIDKAVIRTILNAGEVHFLPKDQMPEGKEVAAVMRY